MAKTFKEAVAELNFPVTLRPNLFTSEGPQNGTVLRGIGQQVYRQDKNLAIANVSDTYGLVPHGAALQPVLQALDGLDFDLQAVKMDHDGRRVMVKAISRQGWTIAEGDEVRLTLMFINSYDRTDALKLMLGAYRLVCSNGLVVAHPAFKALNIERKVVHTQNAVKVYDAAGLVNNVAGLYAAMERQAETWRKMKQTAINKAALESLKEKVLLPIVGKRAVEVIADAALTGKGQDGNLNAWSFYQGFTEVLTGKMEKSKTPVAAEARFQKRTTDFLTAFSKWQEENAEMLVTVNA